MFFRLIQPYQNGTFRSISHFVICVKFVRSLKKQEKNWNDVEKHTNIRV